MKLKSRFLTDPTSSGECVLVSQCNPINDYFDNGPVLSEDMKRRIKEYECGDDNGVPRVFCPTEAEFRKVIETLQKNAKCESNYREIKFSTNETYKNIFMILFRSQRKV